MEILAEMMAIKANASRRITARLALKHKQFSPRHARHRTAGPPSVKEEQGLFSNFMASGCIVTQFTHPKHPRIPPALDTARCRALQVRVAGIQLGCPWGGWVDTKNSECFKAGER